MTTPFTDLRADRGPSTHPSLMRVPAVTAVFWTIKILTTGMGETLSDFLGTHGNELINGAGIVAAFAAVFVVQFRVRRYVPGVYWSCVAMVSVLGTVVADVVHVAGIPYSITSPVFLIAVLGILAVWKRTTGSLDVHTITSRRPELYYWATVMATFALGTAVGDLTANSLHLGYLASTIMFGILILIPLVAWRRGLNPVVSFWIAYVLTRPLGASAADWLADAKHKSGLGFGTGPVTAVWLAAIVVLVGYLALTQRRPTSDSIPT